MTNFHPIILCGGGGTRLWPKSRPHHPKPFHHLLGKETLFESTLARLRGDGFTAPTVVAGEAHVDLILDQARLGELPALLIEPHARNTAPAIALAAAGLDPEAIMVVCPSDHHISDQAVFRETIKRAGALASAGWLVTLGINPTSPETGYGYIERGDELDSGAYEVARFVEKPDLKAAESFVKQGTFSWNSGIFIFTAGTFLQQLEEHRPEMAAAVKKSADRGRLTDNIFHPAPEPFDTLESESVDYAVMENAKKVAVIPVSMGWSDIGNWEALRDAQGRDAQGNVSQGSAELVDCADVFVMSDGPRVSVIGLSNVIVVVDGNEVLVTSASSVQKVGQTKGARGK